ncbi:MAG: hypothetical protein NTAFB05_25950 [Nitrobacter sp.]|uniref:hypothetical protein n=1 Tax=Nitrobacter sp. TaxID=29420 RepID=UPI00387DFD43
MTNRRKLAQQAVTEAEEATEAAFLDMGAAELAWCHAKLSYLYDEQAECLKTLRRARSAFRKHLKECIKARKVHEQIAEELDRKRDRRRQRERLRSDQDTHGLHRSDLTGYHAGRFQRWDHGDDMEAA